MVAEKYFLKWAGYSGELKVENLTYASSIATAIRDELGSTHQSIKTLMKWTNANERTAKNWLAGTHGPSGQHLIALIHYSDNVFAAVMSLSARHGALAIEDMYLLRARLQVTMLLMDRYLEPVGHA